MPVSRRGFLQFARPGGEPLTGAFLAARGLEAHLAEAQAQGQRARPLLPPGVEEIRISSNENPLGPGREALDAILGKFPEAGRYPFNSTPSEGDLTAAIAAKFKVKPENIVVGAGSQEILKNAMRGVRDAKSRGFVTALPTFENCTGFAKPIRPAVVRVKWTRRCVDVGAMITAPRRRRAIRVSSSSTTRTTRPPPCTARRP
jgi:histidinol-phosphate/aromatic aminotransferase/cobyric acid decarboxylase-like protein